MSDQRNAGRQELAVHPRDIRTGDYLRIGTRAGVRVRQAWNVEEQGSTYVKTDDFYYPFVIDWLSRATVERAAAASLPSPSSPCIPNTTGDGNG